MAWHNMAFLFSMLWLLVTANIVPSSLILVTLMMKVICSSKTLVLTGATQCNIPEDDILHSHRCEDLKSFMLLFIFVACNFVLCSFLF
jgi:hypothetical protein